MGPAVVCRAVARPQQAHYQGSVVFPFKIAPDNENALIFCSRNRLSKRGSAHPDLYGQPILQQRYNHNIPPGPQIIHIYMDERRRQFIDFWNQPPAGNTFLVEFGFWGCCGFPGPAAGFASAGSSTSRGTLASLTRARARVVQHLDPHSSSCLHFTFPANRRI